ncbi:MAG: hypothetical protein QT11_C0001G0469 [archaeon GW2011_AR20]|nr:MAG: hypothetical protein QT11_C0001G0469 [archaeon GW2011_AR20]AQS28140.1 hypothetical protein [uncultured archaeon]AQS28740.1 hypothetical protein [uncultured archaeon]MBS3160563.1 hypothetical protein [Candidatus Woesearchaeota archaeon]
MQQAYKETFINKLENNSKVSISGFIIEKNENSIIVDDNTGTLPIIIQTTLSLNTFVRVFGYYNNGQLQGNLIQDLTQINKQLYNKVKLILNRK